MLPEGATGYFFEEKTMIGRQFKLAGGVVAAVALVSLVGCGKKGEAAVQAPAPVPAPVPTPPPAPVQAAPKKFSDCVAQFKEVFERAASTATAEDSAGKNGKGIFGKVSLMGIKHGDEVGYPYELSITISHYTTLDDGRIMSMDRDDSSNMCPSTFVFKISDAFELCDSYTSKVGGIYTHDDPKLAIKVVTQALAECSGKK